jgi:tetratricopeptide (TPR) repeat protein/transcriptional regulator with XRE-family HTH domain
VQRWLKYTFFLMKSFSELLAEYIERVGVSDAELARRLGVSRQTIFRWREGRVQRPRHREDVLRLASKLRLTREESARLILAAGFQPEELPEVLLHVEGESAARLDEHERWERVFDRAVGVWRSCPRVRWLAIFFASAALALVFFLVRGRLLSGLDRGPYEQLHPAQPGETLILVSPFANYGGEQIGYNLAGRLQEALEEAFRESGVADVRIERLPEMVVDEGSAVRIGQELLADVVVWGEYDAGRVIAVLTILKAEPRPVSRERRWHVRTVEELSAKVNVDVPSDVSWLSRYVLGRAYFLAGRLEQAEAVFQRALNEPLDDLATQANVYFFLGRIEGARIEPDLDRVIAYYTEALELQPEMVQALNNRGVAYLERGSVGDLARAEADFNRAVTLDPAFGTAKLNLALTMVRLDPDRLDAAIALLEEAAVLNPESPGVQNGLCWYLSLAGEPGEALPHCDQAVQLDASGYSNDSRGLALALLGRYEEAADEFGRFLDTLALDDPEAYPHFAAKRLSWIEQLEAGEDPFTEAVLASLLEE